MTFVNISSDEIGTKMDELEKEIMTMQDNLDRVEAEKYQKKREVYELSETIRMAELSLSKKRAEMRIMKRAFFRNRQG